MKNNAIAQARKVISYRTICFFSPPPLSPPPEGTRRGQAVEHMHQAVERRHALRQAKGRHRATYPRRPEEAPWETPLPEESAGRSQGTPPQSTTRRRRGGGKRWSTCIKRWNIATLSARRRGDTARPTQGDRRKPSGRRRNPKNRRVGVGERPLSPPPEGAGEGAGGGARASSGGTSPRSPPGEGETPRGPRARNPKNRRGGCRDE